jgi:hypothetical protein
MRRENMTEELYADGIGEITVTGTIVRVDLVSLSATQKDDKNMPRTVFRQRLIMPIDAFANAVDLMEKALAGLVEAGAVKRIPATQPNGQNAPAAAPPGTGNASPNFN